MKKLLVISVLSLALISCVKDSQEYKSLQAQNDSLSKITQTKNKELDGYMKQINDIADNFDKVNAAQSIVAADASEHINASAAKRIANNIQVMSAALQANRQKIAQLQKVISKSGRNSNELKRTLARLMNDLKVKTAAYDSLTQVIKTKDQRIFELNGEVGRLNDDVRTKAGIISDQEDQLSSAYYVFGKKKELKAQNILSKNGFFSRTQVLQKDFNRNYFVKIDTRRVSSIPTYSKKAKIITSHPAKSYAIVDENGTKVIQIKDAAEFWSISKYLVIQTD